MIPKHITYRYIRNDPNAVSSGATYQMSNMWGSRRAGTPPAQVTASAQNTGVRRRAASFSSLTAKTTENSGAHANAAPGKNEWLQRRIGPTNDERTWKASSSSCPVRRRGPDADPRDLAKLKRVFEREESFRTPYMHLPSPSSSWPVSVSALLTRPNDDDAFDRWCQRLDAMFPEERIIPSANEDDSFAQTKLRIPSLTARPASPYVAFKSSAPQLVPKQRSSSSRLGSPAIKAPGLHLKPPSPYAIKPSNHYKVPLPNSGPSFVLTPSEHPAPPCVPDPPFFVRT